MGDPLGGVKNKDGCPINDVGHDEFFSLPCKLVAGIHLTGNKDRPPITTVGGDGVDGFLIAHVGNDWEEEFPVRLMLSQ
jgi:hypothetical protein